MKRWKEVWSVEVTYLLDNSLISFSLCVQSIQYFLRLCICTCQEIALGSTQIGLKPRLNKCQETTIYIYTHTHTPSQTTHQERLLFGCPLKRLYSPWASYMQPRGFRRLLRWLERPLSSGQIREREMILRDNENVRVTMWTDIAHTFSHTKQCCESYRWPLCSTRLPHCTAPLSRKHCPRPSCYQRNLCLVREGRQPVTNCTTLRGKGVVTKHFRTKSLTWICVLRHESRFSSRKQEK